MTELNVLYCRSVDAGHPVHWLPLRSVQGQQHHEEVHQGQPHPAPHCMQLESLRLAYTAHHLPVFSAVVGSLLSFLSVCSLTSELM